MIAAAVLGYFALTGQYDSSIKPLSKKSIYESQSYDAGLTRHTVPYDIPHTFTFINDTNQNQTIVSAEPSCGCTSYSIKKYDLKPGESGSLDMTTTLYGSGGKSTSITLKWLNGKTTIYKLHASVQLPRELTLTPWYLNIKPGETKTALLTYVDANGIPPAKINIQSPEGVQIKIDPWNEIIKPDNHSQLTGRWIANVKVFLNQPLDQSVTCFLIMNDDLKMKTKLIIRTPSLVNQSQSQITDENTPHSSEQPPAKSHFTNHSRRSN